MMDGRDFGPPRSVHVPPPLLSGLAMESHRLGASAASGRIPPSPGHLGAGHPAAALHSGKFLSPTINMQSHHSDAFPGASSFLGGYMSSPNAHAGPSSLPSDPSFRAPSNPPSLQMAQLWASHSHEGFPHISSGLYPGPFLPLGHLEHPQLGQHSLFDSQKEGFYLPGSVHSQSAMARSLVAHLPSPLSREKTQELHRSSKDSGRELGKEKPCKSEPGHSVQRRERAREESRPHSVVDLTQDAKPEDERRVFQQHSPAADVKPKYLLQPSLSNCRTSSGPPSRYPGSESERRERVDENDPTTTPSSGDKPKRLDSMATSLGTLHVTYASPSSLQSSPASLPPRLVSSGAYPPPHHMPPSLYPLCSATKEPAKEHRVTAPTYVPSVEVYDERKGPIQIASQARDNKTDKSRDRDMNRAPLQVGSERTIAPSVRSESPCPGELKRDFVREEGSVIRANNLAVKRPPVLDLGTIKSCHSPNTKDLPSTKHTVKMGLETESRIQEREIVQRSGPTFSGLEPSALHSAETKWKPFEMGNYAASHMAALAAQHTHGPRGEEEGKRMYLDRRGSPGSLQGEEHSEVSAMQSLIKYSGNFSGEVMSKHGADSRNPFGGLGNLKLEASQHASAKAQHLSGKQLKREPERPESTKSFNRDGNSSQGEAEVRHPPVGIAVAVARQRDNGSKLGSVSDRDRPILAGGIKGPGQEEEEQGQERTHHHDGRLLSGRLEHEQEKALRENKNLADYPQLHPPLVSVSSLNPNLMVTGGSALTGAGRWPADPTSHLTSHPWLPRPGPSSMWLPGSPYGLGAPSLHQPLPPGYPPTLPGSIPQAYQFARDPQTGQLVVIPTEHLPHYTAEMLERGPPLWPAVYPPAGSSLQHAHQLQLLSHQQLVRQQELYMIQQQAAQVMELQRSAQFVERLKEQRADMEDKVEKRGGEGTKASLSSVPTSVLHSRKPPPPSPTPSTSHKKTVTPLAVTPLPSPVTSLKSEDRPKVESTLPQQSYSHPSTPAPQPLSPASALSPPPSPIHPKQESVEVPDKEELDLRKQMSASFPSIYPEIPPGYPYQSITASFGSHYPYLLQPATAADAEGLAPAVPLQAEGSKRLACPASVKPSHMCSPVVAEALQASREPKRVEESVVPFKEEPDLENSKEVLGQNVITQSIHSAAPISSQDSCTPVEADACSGAAASPLPVENQEEQDDRPDLFSSSQQELYQRAGSDLDRSPAADISKSSLNLPEVAYTSSTDYTDMQPIDCSIRSSDSPSVHTERLIAEPKSKEPSLDAPDLESTHNDIPHPCPSPPVLLPAPVAVTIQSEDPMAGMLALLTASELPQSGALTTMAELPPAGMVQCPGISLLASTAVEGMALLSQMAELEMQRHQRDSMQGIMHCGLESLLEAGRQVLLEAIECQPQVSIRLPRELNPNKKYSWRQKKDEPMFSKSSLESMDAMEVDYRVRLAELQRCYKDKQRELIRLQKRRDKVEKQQLQLQQQQEERSRNLARRGPGRPRKRKHGLCALSPPSGKLDAKCGKLAQSSQYSEDSESGEVLRKRFRSSTREEEDDEDTDAGILKSKKRRKSWNEQEASSSYSHEVPKTGSKKSQVSEQEQLASKLDKALSLTKLGKSNKASCKFVDGSSAKSRTPSGSRLSMLPDISAKNKMAKSKLSKDLGFFHKSSKGGKNKMSSKLKPSDSCLKGKSQRKASNSPVRSEISSYSNNTDSEEDSMKDGWPPHAMLGRSGPCAQIPGQYSTPSKKKRPPSKKTSASSSSSSCLKTKQGVKERKQKHFALLLQEAGVSSSEDSFDQEYFTERDDYEDEDDEEDYDHDLDEINGMCSSSLEESGLGLLARFAASAIPSPVTSGPMSLIQLEAKQKAKKKEERQNLLGTEFEFTDSESDIKIRKFPSLLHGKRSAPELPLLPPASVLSEDSSPGKRGRKPKAQAEINLSFSAEGSDEERWIRRRSERIFLHDAAQAKPISPSKPAVPKPARVSRTPLHGSKDIPKTKEAKVLGKKKRLKELPLRLPPLSSTPSESSAPLSVGPGRKSKIKPKPREVRGKGGAVSKLMESMAADEDFEPNQDSSFSEDENPRMSTERPCTPAPRNCVLNKDELQDGLRVLIPMDDKLLYAGHVNTVHSPDIYSVVVEGERGNRPHIYCLEQLLQEAIIDVKPPSVRYLPQGTRIAAYWSQQYRCLYPGTVVRGSPDMDEVDDLITVEFDDGDTGRIPLSHIRLLPPDYKIQCAEPSPALLVASTKKRVRKGSKDVPESKDASPKTTEDSAPKNKGRGRKPKPKPEPELAQKEHEKPDQSAPGPVQERPLTTQKSGPLLGRKSQPANTTTPSIPIPAEGQKKTVVAKPPAKVHSQPKSVYSSALYGKVLSVDLYNDPSASLASFMSNNEGAKAKAVKRVRKSEDEGVAFGVKTQRKQPQTEILIKLDHEGVMSPKTKKTKALMMMEGQNCTKRDNKTAVMGVNYTTVTSTTPTDKTLKPKTEPETINTDSVASYGIRKLGSSTDSRASVKSSGEKETQSENCSSSSSSSSESDGEEERRTSPETKTKQDSSSTSSRASSPTSSSSSSSSSSSTAGFNSSSSSSSSSSTTSDEESSCSSDEEAPAAPQPLSPQEQPPTENDEEDVEEKAEVKTESPPSTPKAQKEQDPPKQQAKQQKQQKVKKSVGRPKRREGIHLPTTKELAKRQRLPSVENRPKISAFLPARQLWKWFGKPTQRRGMKGKAKKLFYKAIMRGKEMIRIGDCAVFLSAGRPNLPFIGHIQSMWESWGNNMVVRVKWFYHPEETNPGKKLHDKKNWDQMSGRNLAAVLQASNQRKDFMERALYQSSHVDENDVQTISHKCLVVSLEQYEQMIKTKKYQDSEDLYYLAGTYEPTTGMIFNTDGVPVIC
ncbi:trinucleotide repeat-containing gene 18 protein isoform X1 [Hemibagrus wyckioides]|nr:trinucleotide repeat-containing gene 18 protein isoform X1 [Hemibagrus wyckioides]XP_058234407.1 trinucleotide repeat-containing gene 18 protein isoform X1 [Hemibagrus wyckioides]XP_058234408.1 trinucleotide repeat-containing gene 18 protein isoform X1 [Hemibagrus wyckioides]XP_058234409.1 trinucleotide repeat-containing gene 18 protein isoform X1 [Hemibagrus wyckioides]